MTQPRLLLRALLLPVLLVAPAAIPARAADSAPPRILEAGYPRAFFFRASEGPATRIPYERWSKAFGVLDGIMGKALDEEIPGRSANIPVFTRFKRDHPGQLVMLHFNGNARDPRFNGERYFAGHWLYYNGSPLTSPLPDAAGESVVRVQNPRLFKVNMGRYQTNNEDLAICAVGPDGKPDWSRCEQVQLLALDVQKKTITVRRGAFGTKPLAFPRGSIVMAHAGEGPWGKGSNLLWAYNFSTTCPRDAQGRTAADVLVAEFKEWFAPGGRLAAFDGVTFDVSHFELPQGGPGPGGRGPDADGDGRRDGGVVNGINVYGLGVDRFYTMLREAVGEDRILQSDGMSTRGQRAFGLLNGIESEGFPTLNDYEMADWSGGLNRHAAWTAGARPPVFNYINHKYMERGSDEKRRPEVPFNIHRLAFAAAHFSDAALCYSYQPPASGPGDLMPVWDELIAGAERRPNWLGRPTGEVIRLGRRAPDLMAGAGLQWQSADATLTALPGGELRIAATHPADGRLSATLSGLKLPAGDLLVYFSIRAEPRAGYPAHIPRLAWLACAADGKNPASPLTPERIMTWAGGKPLLSGFYFRNVGPAAITLTLEVEGGEPVYLSGMTVHNAPDAMARRYEHGLVLANPSARPFTFDLRELAPGAALRRLKGTAAQDPKTNSGEAAGEAVTLPARDALFLAQE